jgi:hypothetical protein
MGNKTSGAACLQEALRGRLAYLSLSKQEVLRRKRFLQVLL